MFLLLVSSLGCGFHRNPFDLLLTELSFRPNFLTVRPMPEGIAQFTQLDPPTPGPFLDSMINTTPPRTVQAMTHRSRLLRPKPNSSQATHFESRSPTMISGQHQNFPPMGIPHGQINGNSGLPFTTGSENQYSSHYSFPSSLIEFSPGASNPMVAPSMPTENNILSSEPADQFFKTKMCIPYARGQCRRGTNCW